MTIKARPDLPIGTGEVAKYLKFFWGKVGEFIWGLRFWLYNSFSSRTSRSKLQNVNIILLGAFLDATDAFSDASIVYYHPFLPPLPPLFITIVPSTLLKNCLKFYLAKYTVNISAFQHYCFLQLQLICLYMKY